MADTPCRLPPRRDALYRSGREGSPAACTALDVGTEFAKALVFEIDEPDVSETDAEEPEPIADELLTPEEATALVLASSGRAPRHWAMTSRALSSSRRARRPAASAFRRTESAASV